MNFLEFCFAGFSNPSIHTLGFWPVLVGGIFLLAFQGKFNFLCLPESSRNPHELFYPDKKGEIVFNVELVCTYFLHMLFVSFTWPLLPLILPLVLGVMIIAPIVLFVAGLTMEFLYFLGNL